MRIHKDRSVSIAADSAGHVQWTQP